MARKTKGKSKSKGKAPEALKISRAAIKPEPNPEAPVTDYYKESRRNKKSAQKDIKLQVSRICERYGVSEPAEFLAEVMAGVDPRSKSGVLRDMVIAILEVMGDEGRDVPTKSEWGLVTNMILDDPAYERDLVTAKDSRAAAEKLMDYLYPKLKSMEVSANVGGAVAIGAPLSVDEIKEFKVFFEEEF